jgi:hypothetical protein
LSEPLVIADSPMQGEQIAAAEEARRRSSEAIVAREEARTKFMHLDATAAAGVAREAFPGLIREQSGGPPKLQAGQRITGYVNADAAHVELADNENGLVQSLVPMAVPTAHGWSPVNLRLRETSNVYTPENPATEVRIPKHLSEGVQAPATGLSLTPVDAHGAPLDGSGTLDGATVLFANTQTDTDTVVKPSTLGFALDTMLRSPASPGQLFFRVGLPAGARLAHEQGSGRTQLQVVRDGVTIATIPTPSAHDAAGTTVPVSTSVSGDTLALNVERDTQEFQYPIDVDPEFNTKADSVVNEGLPSTSAWVYQPHGSGFYHGEYAGTDVWLGHKEGEGSINQWAELAYQTSGDSKIYEANVNVNEIAPTEFVSNELRFIADNVFFLQLANSGGIEATKVIAQEGHIENPGNEKVCPAAGCAPEYGAEKNAVSLGNSLGSIPRGDQVGMSSASISIAQPKETHTTVSYDKEDAELAGTQNVLYGSGSWLSRHAGALQFTASDKGVGVAESKREKYENGIWEYAFQAKTKYLGTSSCRGIQCSEKQSETLVYANLEHYGLATKDGEDRIRISADDAMEHTWSSEHGEGETYLKVDTKAPHGLAITGLPSKGEVFESGEVATHVKGEAIDGEGSGESATPASGVRSIALYVDGREVGQPSGSCTIPKGACTAHGEWSLNGVELGSGAHTITIAATDNASNVESKSYTLNVYPASPVAMGPGSVNPESGDLALEATDVGVSGGTGSLAVTRHYDSLNLKEGVEGPLGPQWSISLGSLASLEVLPDKSVMVIGPEGISHFSVASSGGFEAPAGDTNLKLEAKENASKEVIEYLLKDAKKGTTTRFTLPSGARSWMPTVSEGPIAADTVTDAYQTAETASGKIVEPTLELAPHPAVACGQSQVEKLEIAAKGCRALKFTYATATTAKGEKPSEWGEFNGRLMKVSFIAYNPSTAKMESKTTGEYAYDSGGRLRAEWNPQASSELETTYGYDPEGHVTAVTSPGQQPWALVYGTTTGDAGTGRLLKTTRAQPKPGASEKEITEKLAEQREPVGNTEAPKLTGTPTVGVRMAVSKGAWTHSPFVDGFQWYDCNASGGECASIPGATNSTYVPGSGDVGHTLIAKVRATDGNGSGEAGTSPSAVVTSLPGVYTQAVDSGNSLNAVSCYLQTLVGCVASDSKGRAFYATNMSTSSQSTWTTWNGPTGQGPSQAISCPSAFLCVLANGKEAAGGKLYYATSLGGSWSEAYNPTYGVDAISCVSASFCVAGQDNLGYYRYSTNPASQAWTIEDQGSAVIRGAFCLSTSFCAMVDSKGVVHIANSTAQIESSTWKETNVDGTTALNGVACTSTTSCVAVDGVGNVLNLTIESSGTATVAKHDIDGTNNITAISCSGSSTCALVDYAGNVFVSRNHGETWTKQYGLGDKLTAVSCATTTTCAAVDTAGTVTAFNPGIEVVEAGAGTPEPGSTIEYRVPVSGGGAPHNMTKEEIAKWGQKESETPAYAAAIFPPDEPQSWPATSYKRATVAYLDSQARAVNTVFPSGGVSTREYNTENQVTRSLSVDNRAAALKEECKSEKECKSAEVANLLSTVSAYNGEGQLTDSWGPQHPIKLAKGKEGKSEEVVARNHVKYYYNEGAKEAEEKNNESYELVTKTEDGAETASKEEFDKRVTTTSYSGQESIGWKLREPTSTTVDPGGLNLTTTTVYQEITNGEGKKEATGSVEEVRSPGSSGGGGGTFSFLSQFGNTGSEAEKLDHPGGAAIDAHGNVWVTSGASRVDEYSSSGGFIKAYGSWGTGADQFEGPYGVAINHSTGNIYVGDVRNNRIDELNEKGEFVRAFGWGVSNGESKLESCTSTCQTGTVGGGGGQFNESQGVAIDSSGNLWVTDYSNNRVQELNESGGFIKAVGFGVNNGKNELQTCKTETECHAGTAGSGNGQFSGASFLAYYGGNIYVTDLNNNRVEELSLTGEFVRKWGVKGSGNGEFNIPAGISADASGNLYVADIGNSRIQQFSSTGAFEAAFGSHGSGNGQLAEPIGTAITSAGNVDVVDSENSRIEVWTAGNGNPEAHDMRTTYYSAKEEASVPTCRNHPEWANLVCQTSPKAQPGVSGMPELPVTTISYNMWDQPEKLEEAFGTRIRTKKTTFNAAGGALTSEVTASPANEKELPDRELPKVTNTYNKATGLLEEQSTTVAGVTKTIVTKYNTLGQSTTYTDADGNTAVFEYEPEKDHRLIKVADSKGNQVYHYNETTGFLTELVDSAAGAFKAEYDLAGKMSTETYPNAMTATYTHNQVGEMTGLEYKKTAHCEKTCPETWFSDTAVPSVHGETLKQSSTLSEEPSYTYDNAGRLTQAQEVPAGEGCKTRIYTYDEEGNRKSETAREPATEGKCASEGGSVEAHTYDTANTLTDPGVAYDTFGNTTKLPAADAGGSELVSEYYVDSQVAKQEQGGEKIEYKLDPEDRTRETVSTGTTASTVITHFDAGSGAVAWTGEGSGETEKWTRNIPGIDGALTATEPGEGKTGKPAVLLLHDLQGNVVAEAGASETETKLLKKYNSTEFGVPSGKGAPPKYAWLGASGVAGELPSGVITQDGVTYVPQTGRPLQTQSVILTAIVNTPSPLDKPIEEWVGARTGEGGALLVAAAEQRRAEREAANSRLPSVLPMPDGKFCGEGYGPCPEEGEQEGPGGGGGCSGMQACIGSSHHSPPLASVGCSVEASIKTGSIGTVAGSGSLSCYHHKAELEVKVCFYVVGVNPREYAALSCQNKHVKNARELSLPVAMKCERGLTYFTYAWGYVFSENNYEGYIGYVRAAEGGDESSHSHTVCSTGVDLPPGVGE